MGAYVTDRSTLPVAAAASNSNSELTKTSIYSSGPSTPTSKEETHPSFLEYIRLLPTAGPRKSQNVNKEKKTAAILTDTRDKNALRKLQSTSRSKREKLGTRKEKREGCAIFQVRESQEKRRKTSRSRRMQAT